MRKLALSFALLFFISIAQAQVLSTRPLTAEQIAIYRAALEDYKDSALELASRTSPFGLDMFEDNKSCLQSAGILLHVTRSNVVHTLSHAVALNPRMSFIDPGHREIVKKNDPNDLIRNIINGHPPEGIQDLDELDGRYAYATDLFTLSEIAWNKQHTRTALWYSFNCGSLCGQGSLIVLKKVRGKWKISRTCNQWVS